MTTTPSDNIPDFLSPTTFAEGIPHDVYRRLRDEAPVSFHKSPGDPGYWLLTRYHDVHAALIDTAAYSSARGGTTLEEPNEHDVGRNLMPNMDPPSHTRYRKLITRAFAMRAVDKMVPRVRGLCREILDEIVPRGECNFITDVASLLPMHVILELMGIARPDRPRLLAAANDFITYSGTEKALMAAGEVYQYCAQLTAARRAEPAEDLTSYLTTAEVDGEKLTDNEINSFFILLVVAGNETTRNLISGGLVALIQHPDQMALLRADHSRIPDAVEEMLRWVSPLMQFRRTANRDIELHGQTIREGEKVIVAHASANYDERVFSDPYRFDATRNPNPHMAFGVGPHLCLAAALARLETQSMFEELLPRMTDIELAGPVVRTSSNFLHGFQSVPIRFSSKAS